MKLMLAMVVASGLLVTQAVARASDSAERLEAFVEAVESSPLKDGELADFVRGYYDDRFDGEVEQDELDATDLEAEFDAADLATFHTMSTAYLDRMSTALHRLEMLGAAKDRHYRALFGDLILTGSFERARALRRLHPALGLPLVPELSASPGLDEQAPMFIQIAETGEPSRLLSLPDDGSRIIVISHPLCQYSRRALEAIGADPALRQVFADHAIWIVPPQRRFYLDEMREWAIANPGMKILRAARADAGSVFGTRTTPTFYFMRGDDVAARIIGWPDDSQLEKLRDTLAQVKLPGASGRKPTPLAD